MLNKNQHCGSFPCIMTGRRNINIQAGLVLCKGHIPEKRQDKLNTKFPLITVYFLGVRRLMTLAYVVCVYTTNGHMGLWSIYVLYVQYIYRVILLLEAPNKFGKSIPEFGETYSSVLGCGRRAVSSSNMSRSCFASSRYVYINFQVIISIT